MDTSESTLAQHYSSMETYELIGLHDKGTLTDEAKNVLNKEFEARNVNPDSWVDTPDTKEKKKSNSWWPNVNEEKGLKDAIHGGVGVAIWLTVSYLFTTGYLIYTGEGLFTGSATQEEQVGIFIVNTFAILLSLFLAWRIWKKAGYISAIILLLWVISEVGYKFVLAPGQGIIIGIIMLLFAIHGVRGTIKNRFGGGNYL